MGVRTGVLAADLAWRGRGRGAHLALECRLKPPERRGLPLCPHQPQGGCALPGAHRELGARARVPGAQSVPWMVQPLLEVEGGMW